MSWLISRFWNQVGMMHRFIGLRSGRRESFERAEQTFTRALRLAPDFVAAQFNRGLLYWRELGQPGRAIADFTAVLDKQPDALFMRGMAYQALGDYRAALLDLRAFVEQYPDSRWAGNAFSQLRSLDAIVEDLPPQLPSVSGGSTPSGSRNLIS